MSISTGVSSAPAVIIPTSSLTVSTVGANTTVDQGPSSTAPGDTVSISLRARALQKWQQDDPSFQPPGDDATQEVKQKYEAEINAYEGAI